MALVKVWNDNIHEYKEFFRDKHIKIPSKAFVLMDAGDAHLFQGTFNGLLRDGDNQPDPRGFKMIRIESYQGGDTAPPLKVDPLVCNVCRYAGANKDDLTEHEKTHGEQGLTDPEAEEVLKQKKLKEPAPKVDPKKFN